METVPHLRTMMAALAAGLVAASSCSSAPPADPFAVASDDAVGAVGVALQIEPGVTLASVSFTISGPGGYSQTGAINVASSTTISATIGGLPAGTGYSITVGGTASDGGTTCGGSATFDVTAHATTSATVHLTCKEPVKTGSVQVSGNINVCPGIDNLSSNPGEVTVGGTIALFASAHDRDAGPSPLTYQWTGNSGTFSSATAQNPTFTCTTSGVATVQLTVSDGDPDPACRDSMALTVTCS